MIYRFGSFELDLAKIELRSDGQTRPIEPQVFALLALLLENRERAVSRDELIEKVWDGRVVSDAAVASRVKSARRALGDDGQLQRFIRTIHGHGFRFVADAHVAASGGTVTFVPASASGDQTTRPSLAVLPFRAIGDPGLYATLALALPDELITELSRLRWLTVSARGSSFRLRSDDSDFEQIGRLLSVRYCLSGSFEVTRGRLALSVELVNTADRSVIWADRLDGAIADVHALRETMRARILVALDIRIPVEEAALARDKVTDDLDAWGAYHLGLQHLYRFNRADNAAAASLFKRAITLDPGFARAHAGVSFVHFQTAFLKQSDDIAGEIDQARRFAQRGIELDPLDPFVNFTMGRSYWLEGDLDSSLGWLERATVISPNYAQGIYARAWSEALAGRAIDGRQHVDLAMSLSPLDPLYYAMLATRAFTHIALGEDQEAVPWAERAARSPGAHVLIAMIAAVAHALAGDSARAASWAAKTHERNPALTRGDFLRSFPIKPELMRGRVDRALAQHGF